MKPHLAHIKQTLVRKQRASEAGNRETAYRDYKKRVDRALDCGYGKEELIGELMAEEGRIKHDIRLGDSIFLQGVVNAKNACLLAIEKILSELKEEPC